MREQPRHYVEERPTKQSVRVGDCYINLTHLSEDHRLDHSYLSRIFAGQRVPSVPYLHRIASALGMSMEGLLDAIQQSSDSLTT